MITLEQKKESITKFSDESPCLCFNIRKAARAITQVYDDMFRTIGLRSSQVAILNSLKMLGPLTVSQLAEAMATDRTTITRNLKPLERDGYVEIQPGLDRRSREIHITKKGKSTAAKAFTIWEQFQEKVCKRIGNERLEKLCKELSEALSDIQGM